MMPPVEAIETDASDAVIGGLASPVYSGTLTFAWRLDGLLGGRTWPAGAAGAATLTYDAAKRPTGFAKIGTAAASFAQAYDRDGNVTAEGRSLTGVSGDAGTNTQTFTYDGANRVTGASGLSAAASYGYDRDANRTSATLAGLTTTYAYDRAAQLISRTDAGVTTYLAYDQFGNQTSSAPGVNLNTAFGYDLADRLLSIDPPTQGATTFGLDALGRNLTRVTPGGTDAYEYVGSSETAWRITTGGVATSSALDPSGARLATTSGGGAGHLLADLHGNAAAVVNAAETALLSATRYDAYGQVAATYDAGGSFPVPWRFQGRLDLSPDAHPLYEFSARLYDPAIGAFTSLDTYPGSPADPLSLNRYLYAAANPWTLIDPSGHYTTKYADQKDLGESDFVPGTGGGTIAPETYPVTATHWIEGEPITAAPMVPYAGIPYTSSSPPATSGSCPGVAAAAALGLGTLGLTHALLAGAAVAVAPTVVGEVPVLIAEGAALYATWILGQLLVQASSKPCDLLTIDVNPFG